jgi:hypothetical protein
MHAAQALANAPRRTRSLPLRLMPQRLAVGGVTRHCLGASSPIRFHADVPLLPVGRGGSSRPPEQKNCTTGQPNRTDSGRRRLPEETSTIRAWSRQTLSPRLRAAPASVAAADRSASLSEVCLPGSLVMPDQREVCTLSRQGDVALWLNPYPHHYSTAFAFSLLLYPLPRRLALRFAFPRPHWIWGRGDNRLTTFRRCTRVDRTHLYAGGSASAPEEFEAPGPGHLPFGPSVSAACIACSL